MEAEILAKHGRHAAFEAHRGEPKIMVSSLHSRFVLGTLLLQGWPAEILETEILAKHRRHAAFEARRGEPKIMVSSLHSCVRGTGGAKTLNTEKKG